MDLVAALAKTSLTWTIEQSSQLSVSRTPRPLPTMLVKVCPTPGGPVLTREFRTSPELTVEQMLFITLSEQLPDNETVFAWKQTQGYAPVRLAFPAERFDSLGEYLHSGLRKLGSTPTSLITWSALHELHSDDRVSVWEGARAALQAVFLSAEAPSRRMVAQALRDTVLKAVRSRCAAAAGSERSQLQRQALLMLDAGCSLAALDEWMWSWLGYVVEDVPSEQFKAA